MDKVIPYGRQHIDEEDILAVIETLKSDYLTTGPKIAEFEEAFAKKVGAKYAVAVCNGTAALHAAAFALELKPGDEVITTAITFAATSNAVLYMGATPVFVDIDPVTYNIDVNKIREKINSNTKAIFPVHFTGQPCQMDEIIALAKEYNLAVVEDASHALGATYKGQKIGSISDMTTFSLHPVKHITTGEGGMITTNSEELYRRLKRFRSHGITREISEMINYEGGWYYEQQDLGFNYRLTDIQAALGLSQLKKLDYFVNKRIEIAEKYTEKLAELSCVKTPVVLDGLNSSWHLYVVQIDFELLKINKNDFFNQMKSFGIGLNVHYIPVYKHPYYQKNGYEDVICMESEKAYKQFVSLPIFYDLSDEDQNYVIDKLIKIVNLD